MRFGLFGLSILLMLMGGTPLMAQNTCADPFGDVQPRFSTSYWTLTDFCSRSIDLSEIRSGGPPPDGIPPIDDPQFESLRDAATWLVDASPVIALSIEGDARAYPLAILTWHEIANDVVGGVPVAVTFCPLCNAALVFDRRVDGETLRFGVSGLLRNSDMVMWDDRTQSFWQQFGGEGIVGAYTGTQLTVIDSWIMGFGDFTALYPDGRVLSRTTGETRSYGSNPYAGYDGTERPFLFEGEIDPRLPATAHVLGGVVRSQAVAYSFEALREQRAINDQIEDVPVVALWQDGVFSALDAARIDESRDIGTAALYRREVDGQTLTFAFEDGAIRDAETGSTWNAFGMATDGTLAGTQLRRLPSGGYFWFAWAAFMPDTRLVE
jgi:hypothetical protein